MILDPRDLVLDLTSLRTGSNRGVFEIDMTVPDWRLDEEIRPRGTGRLELEVNYRERSVIVRGRLDARFGIPCSRCLEDASFAVTEEVFAVYSMDDSLDADTPAVRIPRSGRQVSILDAVREAVILSVPGKTLCRDDCRGICIVCGANLNSTRCGHADAADAGCVR